ncbi:MAG TPA: UDP-N-acetylmuramoyl-tripeptide--D-alanyl-D-alanine ligase [Bryobacteraceae bacterium]|nr:UDP-N-acetylmuramoyl-tripeptide--D-alanyl-D-alanine ligase [Bryobacteraceae bacterium]
MRLPLQLAARALGTGTVPDIDASGWSIDSRTLAAGDVFFAIRGDLHDGHTYVQDALGRGAAAAVVADTFEGRDTRLIKVEDTLTALQRLGTWARERWGGTVIGVTGSAGKTSTKDVVAALIGSQMPVGRNVGNLNNHIGLPLSILRLPDEARVAVLEMGMNHSGEIRHLCSIAKPEIGVVTNVGYAHVENFEDGIEGIASAKRELIDSLPEDGAAVLNFDDERVRSFASAHRGRTVYYGFSPGAEVRAEDVLLREDGVQFRVGSTDFRCRLTGRHAISNVLAGIAAARVMEIDENHLREIVGSLEPAKMRGERIQRNGVHIINDCYNSNPEAVRSMLEVLRDTPAKRRIAVLGEMLELGRWAENLHRDAGKYAALCGTSVLVGIRGAAQAFILGAVDAGLPKDAAYFFDDPTAAGTWLREVAHPGDAILFKGSRGTRVEKALEAFLEGFPG